MGEAATNKRATLEALRKLLERGQTDEVLALVASLLDNLGGLSLEVARLKRSLVGRKSEKLDPNQLSLMLELLDESREAHGEGLAPRASPSSYSPTPWSARSSPTAGRRNMRAR
ncbi:Transposase C of IS166 homeodomain protein [Enhygromyxa salina]|uniref:Transposase C of IS166 homeodomain protein n=1 Tax=Enhygromyxa salina TaxID=215803 RepID=A0A2S9YD83_9BACT|nr:hypothetical protein [Enhygromyxa salina]PRQ02971.1 Transposase C of IS166 homeodomain protein [Enhygromyxa salina]